MALEIYWTEHAKAGLFSVLLYLEENWSLKEILKLEEKLKKVIELISLNPGLFPHSSIDSKIFKAVFDKNNCLYYKLNKAKNRIDIIDFRETPQFPKYQ